ncbi:DUF3124 domain-containing protein [uncultured Aquimarina sp.]|uniref:DUF3124 domain-containing protein n=1 Tax=uncultured Aquimarina sp. TaxID=575652 RepID=UPI00262D1CA9|nr:DUF3124 domain-containing protein [uncultured Aquimarina sp.]
MKLQILIAIILIINFSSCEETKLSKSLDPENWSKRTVQINTKDSLSYGKSYLSVYSQIYSISEKKIHNLTSMISMRNMSEKDTIYLLRAEYYDTHGKSVRKYFELPIYLAPLETTEIVIDEIDISGGTGSNFIFEWKIPQHCPEPLFEGVMTSTMGQQGLSFLTEAKRIE